MKIKQLKEKTIKGFIDFLPKVVVDNIEGLSDILNDKLSKSEGGEVNKHIIVTNKDSDYSTIINPDGSIYIWSKKYGKNILSVQIDKSRNSIDINTPDGAPINIGNILNLIGNVRNVQTNIYDANADKFTASKFVCRQGTDKQVLLGDGSTTSNLIRQISIDKSNNDYTMTAEDIGNKIYLIKFPGATEELAGLMTAADKTKLDDVPNIYAKKSKTISNITVGNSPNKRGLYIAIDYADRTNPGTTVNIPNATTTSDGCMSYEDKNKLDDIPNTYLPLSGGIMSGNLYISNISAKDPNGLFITNVTGLQHVDQDKANNPEVWTTNASSIPLNKANGIPTLNENGKIDEDKIDDLKGYVSTLNGHINATYNEYNNICYLNISGYSNIKGSAGEITIERTDEVDGDLSSDTIIRLDGITGSIEATSATFTDKVKANGFLANYNGNGNTAWTTNGGSIDLINLFSNAAIYVAGEFELAESGIDNTTVVDSPNSIIFDNGTKRFLARKGLTCYTHWKADISKNIAPPSRYGIETDNGVFPFNNQMYKFSSYDNIFIATCSNGTCSMKILTLE